MATTSARRRTRPSPRSDTEIASGELALTELPALVAPVDPPLPPSPRPDSLSPLPAELGACMEDLDQLLQKSPDLRARLMGESAPGPAAAPPSPAPLWSAAANPSLHDKACIVEVLNQMDIVRLTNLLFPGHAHEIDHEAMRMLMDQWLADCGQPTDPLERQLCQRLLMTSHAASMLLSRLGTYSAPSHLDLLSRAIGRLEAIYQRGMQTLA
jgi:hypothetical protein